jgi:F0F1-type ATP synthase assembly protein I
MQLTTQKTTMYSQLMKLSAWGFSIVLSSFLFLYIGYHIDRIFNTAPSFMFGLFLLAVGLCIGRLYRDAWMMGGQRKS